MSIFRPLATHAEGHLEVTTIVVVVIDIYLYNYYYLNGHSEMVHGPLPSAPAASCATVVVASRARGPGWLCTRIGARPFRFARFPFRALGAGLWPGLPAPPCCPGSGAVRSFSGYP